MSLDRQFLKYLREQRADRRSRIGLFHAGHCWVQELRDGRVIDVTSEMLERLEDQLEEMDTLLGEAGVSPDA